MFEDTNQTALKLSIQFFAEDGGEPEGMDEDGDELFAEDPEDTNPEATEGTEPSGEAETGAEGGNPEEDTNPDGGQTDAKVKVRYLGQERELSMSELVTAAQKGLDYDHVRQERDALRQSPELLLLDQLAEEAGLTRAEYIRAVQQRREEMQIADDVKNGVPEETARRLRALEAAERRRKAEEAQAERKRSREQELQDFIRAYPDVKEFPEEVLDSIRKGEKPLAAYQAYENRMLKARLAAFEKNSDNKRRSPGSLAGSGSRENADAFSEGFDSI